MTAPKTIYLKPRGGLIVRDPLTALPLAAGGEEKPDNAYWRRRLNEGAVDVVPPPKPKAKKE